MKCFSDVILEKGSATLKNFEHVPQEDIHNIQTHAVEIGLLVSKYCGKYLYKLWVQQSRIKVPPKGICYIPKAFKSDN